MVYLVIETSAIAPCRHQGTTQTIPLLSAVLLARLIAQAVEGEVTLSTPGCFTESTVSLFWIRGVEKT